MPQHYLSQPGEIRAGLAGLVSLPLERGAPRCISAKRWAREEEAGSSFLRTSLEGTPFLVTSLPHSCREPSSYLVGLGVLVGRGWRALRKRVSERKH